MFNLCTPALIYVIFSLTQIIIDTSQGMYNTAFVKTIVAMIITCLLNWLCETGMGIVSWIIVFIPFLFMSVIVALLLFVFGLDPATGKAYGGNMVYSSSTNSNTNSNTTSNASASKYVDVTYSEAPAEIV